MKIISSKEAYSCKVFHVTEDEATDGKGYDIRRSIVRHAGSAVMMAVDDEKRILLVRQYRLPAAKYLWELPAGKIDEGETAAQAAKRELIEETGYRAKKWSVVIKYFASPGFLGEWMQIYLARDIRTGEAKLEPDETLEVFRLRLSEALALIAQNKIHDGKTIIGLTLYATQRATRV